ncbi:hypothetical protein PPL_11566 [Heterostelium album PN500]|uniref:Uncharacterized protein n=1 Tax=Heterostelium pallidum (strain ATCC 26659 / Pp 5 / PN500) TaxID=670386 RepID=D3BVH5_HETP5|nr:hypothetical protein PPL_11566 [Heterostelium album PN500]EFA74598.1 hypothetical protein PPL_11566 [Heterostelium album PN500]|eukprot:XP_020426732.1 hypothetical protein PPL_11566 [Heterostelium album PN500]
MNSSNFINITTVILLSLVSVSLAGQQYGFAYLKYFNTQNCSSESEYGGSFQKAGTCVGKMIYDCSGGPDKIGVQKYKDYECTVPIGKMIYHQTNTCLEHVINNEYYGYSASCVDSLLLPQQSTVNFGFTGNCESPNWKEHIIISNYNLLDKCVLLPHGSAQYSCNSTDLITSSYTAYNNNCGGEPERINTTPFSVLNFCSEINEINFCLD